jgi:hypothetical protein
VRAPRYFATDGGLVRGPIGLEEIKRLVDEKKLPEDVAVCQESGHQWVPLNQVSMSSGVKQGSVDHGSLPSKPRTLATATAPVESGSPKSASAAPWLTSALLLISAAGATYFFLKEPTTTSPTDATTIVALEQGTPATIPVREEMNTAAAGAEGISEKRTTDETNASDASVPAPSASMATRAFTDSGGRIHQIPAEAYPALLQQKQELDMLGEAIDKGKEDLKLEEIRIERERVGINRSDPESVRKLNERIIRFNATGKHLEQQIEVFNRIAGAFNKRLSALSGSTD